MKTTKASGRCKPPDGRMPRPTAPCLRAVFALRPPWPAIALLLMAASAAAQDAPQRRVVLPAESKETALRLEAADRLVRPEPYYEEVVALVGDAASAGPPGLSGLGAVLMNAQRQQWPKALEEYQRIIYDEGYSLVSLDAVPTTTAARSVQARLLCHLRIAAAPPWARAVYDRRVKNLADNLFREGQENHNLQAWRQLVGDHFCSAPAGKALELLGDIAFEQGDFAQARQWWSLLADLPSGDSDRPGRLAYPAGAATRARAQARQIIALAQERDIDRARAEWRLFEKIHGKMPGKLAGKQGVLADTIKEAIDQSEGDRRQHDMAWHSFGCDATRNQRVPASPHARLWADGPTWRVFLAEGKKADSPDGVSARAVTQPARRLAFHPVISGDVVLVAGARAVTGYHLLSGDKLFRHRLKGDLKGAANIVAADDHLPDEPEHSYTLTVSGKRIYVRLGAQKFGPAVADNKGSSHLVCLEMTPGKKAPALEVREVWRVPAQADNEDIAQFEGSPIVDGNRVHVAVSRLQGRRTLTALVCYDAGSGAARWSQDVCDAEEFESPGQPRVRHHLATLAGRYLVYCSHAGAVAAVDADTGKPAWAIRYPSEGLGRPDGTRSPRDLCPVVFAAGRLYVAPADSDRILCLEPASGQVLWERDGIEVVHLLGVSGERLFFTTPTGLRAVRADRGTDQGGWSQPADGRLPPFGRGLLAGSWVFWPTADPHFPLRVVTQDEGGQEQVERAGDPAPVFDPTQLHRLRAGNMVYASGCLVIAGTEELVGYVPAQRFLDKLRLQARLPSAGARAFLELAEAEAGAGLDEDALRHFQAASMAAVRDGSLRRRALRGRHELLMKLSATPDRKRAVPFLEQAGEREFPAAQRLAARLALADLTQAGEPQRAVAILQAVLLDDDLREGSVLDAAGLPRPAFAMLRDRIQRLIDKHGPGVYAAWEEQAGKRLLTVGRDRAKLEGIARRYPNSLQVKQALAAAWPRPQARVQKPRQRASGPAAPLTLAWEQPASAMLPLEMPGQAQALILVHADRIALCDPATGKPRWQRPSSFPSRWAGQHDDLIVLAGKRDIEAVHAQDGRLAWQLRADETAWGDFDSFQLTPSHLLFLHGERRLIAVRLDTGEISWSRFAPGASSLPLDSGRFSPHYLASAGHVLIQGLRGQVLCLAAASGEPLRATARMPTLWRQAPLPLDAGRAYIAAGNHAALVDVASGREIWKYEPPWPTSSSGEPLRIAGDEKALLVIVPRNYGYEVERLDAATGRPLWDDEPRLLSRCRLERDSLAVADDAFYYAGENSLTCRSLATGKVVWKKELPGGARAWQLHLIGTEIVVAPARVAAQPWLWLPAGSFLLGLPASAQAASSSILIFDRRDGRLQQALDRAAPATGTAIAVFPQIVAGSAGGMARGWRGR